MTQAALLDHVTKTIVARFHPKRIVVFGSHARGTAGPDSDVDLSLKWTHRGVRRIARLR